MAASVSPLGGSPPASPRGLPIVPDTALPASVRSGSAADKQSYKAALGFEQMLVDQMVQSMAGDGSGDGSDDDGTGLGTGNPLASGPYAQQMQTAMSTAIESSGGLGLAQQLYTEIKS